jgi:alpha-mannosidase
VLAEQPDYALKTWFKNDMRIQMPESYVLENECLRVQLDPNHGGIASFYDKAAGLDLAAPQCPGGVFRLGTEAVHKQITGGEMNGMSAWFTGRWRGMSPLTAGVEIAPACSGPLRAAFRLRIPCGGNSGMNVILSLDKGARQLCYDVDCDWREVGSAADGVPNLHYFLPLGYNCDVYRYDAPNGVTSFEGSNMDRPAQSYVMGENRTGAASLAILSMDKYGVRCYGNAMALTLLRGSYNPDETPDIGRHHIRFAVASVPSAASNADMQRISERYRFPVTAVSGTVHGGALPGSGSFMRVDGDVLLSAVKQSETGGKLVLRFVEMNGRAAEASVTLPRAAASACMADALEQPAGKACTLTDGGKSLKITVPPYSIQTVMIDLAIS